MKWNISPTEFRSLFESGADEITILDVREPEEFEQYRIPESILIPIEDLYYRGCELKCNRPIYIICEHGIRSLMAVLILSDLGLTDVYNIMGGFEKIIDCPGIPIDKKPIS